MANDALQGSSPPRPSKPTPSSASERERRIAEGSEPSVPSGGTYFLGRYRVVDEIGVGGMASVHLARADGPGGFQKWVAIKRIHRHLAEDEQFIRMFLDEARIAARISHPNVAQVFDLGKHRDTYWIAMEYLHGEPLREIMRAVEESGMPHMTPQLAAKIVADAAEGLHAAHELRDKDGRLLNLVHRDVTPHNLFLTYDGAVKVVDFGIAKVTGRLSTTRAGTLKGKLAYMSPEQVHGVQIDRRTDIFALGVVLWELTTGKRLFRMDSDLETLERVQACVVPPPSSIVEKYPMELESVVMRTLAKDANKRFPTARELSKALQQYVVRAGAFIGPEEVGAYVKQVLQDRYQKREAHLQWAAEVTQTVSLEQLEGAKPAEGGNGSLLTFASDVQEVPKIPRPPGAPPPTSRPGAGPHPPRPIAMPPPTTKPHSPRPAAGALPDQRGQPLPKFENTNSNTDNSLLEAEDDDDDELVKTRVVAPLSSSSSASAAPVPRTTVMGLGPGAQRLPSYELSSSNSGAAAPAVSGPRSSNVFHDYGSENEEAVTTVMAESADSDESQTISTVHEPAKSQRPAPSPDDAIVVAPTLLMPDQPFQQPMPTGPAMGTPMGGVAMSGASLPYPHPQMGVTQQRGTIGPSDQQRSSVLIAVIAAATTLIALTLTALVVLKITESPKDKPDKPVVPTTTMANPGPTVTNSQNTAPQPSIVVVQPTAQAQPDKPVNPESLPSESKDKKEPKPTAGATPRPAAPAPAPAPAPAAPAPDTAAPAAGGGSGPGFLTVVCDPFCDSVSAGGKNLGPSPVVRAALPPGTHGVGLKKGSTKKSLSVTIVSGQTTARRVKMD